MDTSASPTYEDLQRRLRDLEERDAAREAETESLRFLADATLDVLTLQRGSLEPQGFWVPRKHEENLRRLSGLPAPAGTDAEATWTWHQITTTTLPGALPVFSSSKVVLDGEVVPFQRAFPLELFVAIVAHADTQTIFRSASASFACYELFMPFLLERVETLSDRQQLCQIFEPGDPHDQHIPRSARLDLPHCLKNLRFLTIKSSWLDCWLGPVTFIATRLPSGSRLLELDLLTIVAESRDLDEDEEEEDQLASTLDSEAADFLAQLNPRKLVVREEENVLAYVVSRAASLAVSRWSRLESVVLEDVFLLTSPLDDMVLFNESDGVFFLSERTGQLSAPSEVDFVWDLSEFAVGFPYQGYEDLVHLLHQDDTFRQPWVKSFTVIVGSEESGQRFQELIDESEGKAPSCIGWEVKQPEVVDE